MNRLIRCFFPLIRTHHPMFQIKLLHTRRMMLLSKALKRLILRVLRIYIDDIFVDLDLCDSEWEGIFERCLLLP